MSSFSSAAKLPVTRSRLRTDGGSANESQPRMPLPTPRGPLSRHLINVLTDERRSMTEADTWDAPGIPGTQGNSDSPDILSDDDAQLTLAVLYELHLRGIDGVDDRAAWNGSLLGLRARLEVRLWTAITARIGDIDDPDDVCEELFEIGSATDGPSLARYMARSGTLDQFREIVIHRSLNQLREADVHTLAIPRLHGRAKAALIEVQFDEYGGGAYEFMHAALYARLMDGLDLDSAYAHYVDQVPAPTLAALNTLSYLGFHRSRIHELIGHLCAVEMSSSLPSRDYSRGLRRLGIDSAARIFFDEHVEADSVHEQLVVRRVAGVLGSTAPARIGLLRGALACNLVEGLAAEHIWSSWQEGRSSLRPGGPQ